MTRSITLSFPWPPRELSPNVARRLHWSKKAAATKVYREQCGWETVAQTGTAHLYRFTRPVLATTTFYVDSKRRYDMRNLDASLKPLWDGVVYAGILADDD